MKKKTQTRLYRVVILILVFIVFYLYSNPKVVKTEVKVPVKQDPIVVNKYIPVTTQKVPDFRQPPVKTYKPGYTQQVGVLTNASEEVLPLYGKESRTHRDRYHYYTNTGGLNLYPIPVTYKGRDCMEDLACNEIFDGEPVSVLGKTGEYTANIYRTNNFF